MEHISLPIKTKFEKVEQINAEFTRCKCYIMALGKNRNGSHFSRESVEDALSTFKNIPVIAFLYEGEDGNLHVAGHEMKVVERDGKMQWATKCIPYGTVPDGAFTFEEVTESDGTKATYLTSEVILWSGKYPEIMDAIYSDDCYFNQSMEIKCLETKKLDSDERYIDITKFSASALCLLGKSDDNDYNVTPCFPSSSVVPYSFDEQFTQLMDEFKFALADCFSNINKEGCEVKEMNIEAILAEFGLTMDQIDFEIGEEMTEEALREKLTAFVENMNQEPAVKTPAEFSSTYMQKREAIADALAKIGVRDEENDHYEYFWAMDFDDQYLYVEHYVYENDNDKRNVGRIPYSYNEEEKIASVTGEFEEMFIKWLTAEELETLGRERDEFIAYRESHSTENSEVEELRAFRDQRLAEDHQKEVDGVLAEFEDLRENEEFKALCEIAVQYTDMEQLKDRCYAIRGKTMKETFSQKTKPVEVIPVANNNTPTPADELYGGLFSIYK